MKDIKLALLGENNTWPSIPFSFARPYSRGMNDINMYTSIIVACVCEIEHQQRQLDVVAVHAVNYLPINVNIDSFLLSFAPLSSVNGGYIKQKTERRRNFGSV